MLPRHNLWAFAFLIQTAMLLAVIFPASAQMTPWLDNPVQSDRDVFVLGGVMTEDDFSQSLTPGSAPLADNYILGAALNRKFVELGYGLHLGGEVGVAGRFGGGSSAELWGGPSL